MIPAPTGWGWVPGTDLSGEPEQLPDIPELKFMTRNDVMRMFVDVLIDRPTLLKTVTGNQLKIRYPDADKYACYSSIDYARAGKRPKKFNRTSKLTAAKPQQQRTSQ